jgi:hypothetical protein
MTVPGAVDNTVAADDPTSEANDNPIFPPLPPIFTIP